MTFDVEEAKARQEQLFAEAERLRGEAVDLMYAVQREEDRPLVGRYFKRQGIGRPDPTDDHWFVWTRVDSFDDQRGAIGVEFHHAGGEWYSIKMHEHVRHDEAGDELTEEQFYADVQPLLDALAAGGRIATRQPQSLRKRRVRVRR